MPLIICALLNVVHNLRRTVAAVLIIALGTGLLFLSHAYLQGLYAVLSLGIRNQAGDLQIHHADYQHGSPGAQPLIPGAALARVERVVTALPEVRTVSRELLFGGLLQAGERSTGVAAVGVETDRLNRGAASRRLLVAGRDLTSGDHASAILGEGVARQLAVASQRQGTLFVHDAAGAERTAELHLKGVVRTGSSINDAYAIYVPLPFARELVDTAGAHRILVFLRPLRPGRTEWREQDLEAVRIRLRNQLADTGLPVAVSSWREVQDLYDQLKSFYDLLFTFAIAVITVLSMVAIFEVVSVAFLERLRELGSLRAIGTTRAQLLLLLLVESLATYLLGAAAALGLGLTAGAVINALEITFFPIGSNLPVPFAIHLDLRYFLVPAAITLLMTAGAALVPVLRTARMSVAQVLRYE